MIKRTGNSKSSKDGVALIIVLGLLAVLTLLAVAFAIAMRVERLAARNYADLVRAKHLIQVGIIRAMEHVDLATAGTCFPAWSNVEPDTVYDALSSLPHAGSVKCPDLLTGEALSFIPGALRADAQALTNDYVHWTNIVDQNGTTNGRIVYLVSNCSGLLDVNHNVGAAPERVWSTNISEIDISSLPDITPAMTARDVDQGAYSSHAFFADRDDRDVRYETIRELGVCNSGVTDPNSNLFVFSYDPGRDVMFKDRAQLGMRGAEFTNKFYLHAITNYDCFYSYDKDAYRTDPDFLTEYYEPLVLYLKGNETLFGQENDAELYRAEDVAWNIINYLDTNRIPQTGSDGDYPWRHTEGTEPIPLVNEIVLRKADDDGMITNRYEFVVEFWYPFYPVDVKPDDRFSYEIAVFSNNWAGRADAPSPLDIMSHANPDWSFSGPILDMSVSNQFMLVTSPKDKVIYFEDVDGDETNYPALGATDSKGKKCSVWFLARIKKADWIGGVLTSNICDEAMGYDPAEEQINDYREKARRALLEFDQVCGYSVNDPRSNGQRRYWWAGPNDPRYPNQDGEKYAVEDATLGSINDICNPWTRKGQGLPIFFRNDLMKSIGEIGHVFGSNNDDETQVKEDWWWQSINLLCYDQGAFLLDRLTVRPTNMPEYGLVNISTRQREVLYALLNRAGIGTNFWYRINTDDPDELDNCVDAIIANGPYVSFGDMFPENVWHGGPVGDGFIGCAPTESLENQAHTNDILREASFRSIIDLISFRQNIFTVIVAAQVYGKDQASVVAEKRGVAIVYRDSYTGRSFVRSFKWLMD